MILSSQLLLNLTFGAVFSGTGLNAGKEVGRITINRLKIGFQTKKSINNN